MLKKLIEEYRDGFATLAERKKIVHDRMINDVAKLIDVPFRRDSGRIVIGAVMGEVGPFCCIDTHYSEETNRWRYIVGHGSCDMNMAQYSGSTAESKREAVEILAEFLARRNLI